MTSFNRVPCDHFDVTLFSPEQVRQELARIWRQIPKTPKRPHYKMDPMKSRLDDVNCLYFPTGFATKFRWRQIRCRTLGQFIAIQFNEYIDRLIKESDQGERLARKKRRIKQEIAHTDEDLEILDKDIKKWREINDQCFKGAHSEYDNVTWPPAMGRAAAPNCAVECSLEFMVRMGYELLWNRVCMHGKICELDEDEGIEIRRESTEPCRSTWHALDVLDEEEGYGSEWSDDETDHENKVNKPRAALDFFPEEYHASLLMGL